MDTPPEVKVEEYEAEQRRLLQAILNAPDGQLKEAADAGQNHIRRVIRENAYHRVVLPPRQVADSELTRLPKSDGPVVIEEMEPHSPGAKTVSFNDTADTAFFRADVFVVYFARIVSREFTKNVDELRTTKCDVRQMITDNSLKDMQTEEDFRWQTTVDEMCGDVGGVGAAGVAQNFEIPGTITRETYPELQRYLNTRRVPNGTFLLNRNTALEFLKWPRNEIGGDLAEKLMLQGVSALQEAVLFGVKHVFTIKDDLVPDNVVYQFTEPGFLGRTYILQNVTMYVKKDKDILTMSAVSKIGTTFANVAGVNKGLFLA